MLKVFDFVTEKIQNIRDGEQIEVCDIIVNSSVLDMPVKDMMKLFDDLIDMSGAKESTKKYLYTRVCVEGKYTKEDLEDLYDAFESALTQYWCKESEPIGNRMGEYGLPKLKIKVSNLLRWMKWQVKWHGMGFEVVGKNSVWKKRMVK